MKNQIAFKLYYRRVIAQPLTSWPSNPEIRGSSPAQGLSRSQRLGAGLLLGDREVIL